MAVCPSSVPGSEQRDARACMDERIRFARLKEEEDWPKLLFLRPGIPVIPIAVQKPMKIFNLSVFALFVEYTMQDKMIEI